MRNTMTFEPRPRDTAKRIYVLMGVVEQAFTDHSAMVAEGAVLLGNAMRLPALRLARLEEAAWLHDVLLSDSTVAPTEMEDNETFRSHPLLGAAALRRNGVSEPVCQIVEQHHERWDGQGFPRGLKGGQILLEARIIALADGISHLGPHMFSPAFPGWAPMAERLVAEAGRIWDPFIVAAFLNACRRKPCPLDCEVLTMAKVKELLVELQGTGPRACTCAG